MIKRIIILIFVFLLPFSLLVIRFYSSPITSLAYSTNMSASVVIGQTDFIHNSFNQGGSVGVNTLFNTYSSVIIGQKMVVADSSNHRILIFNSIPSTNGVSADVVIGQADFTHNSANQGGSVGANTLKNPRGIATDGTRLFVADYLNRRVLIYNSLPNTNNASADIVIGQANMNSAVNSATQTTMQAPSGVYYDSDTKKLFVADTIANRVLIYNSIPTANGASADVVIGQADFTHNSANQGGSVGSNTLNQPADVLVINNKLFVVDTSNQRDLIFNSIPTSNNASADVVIGQADFTHNSANQGGSVGANTLNSSYGANYDGKRLFIADGNNHRVLIFNSIPTSNNASADVVIGQADFTHNSANQGGSVGANTLNIPNRLQFNAEKLILSDSGNGRILIFNNILSSPSLSFGSFGGGVNAGDTRYSGSVTTDSTYTIKSVEYNINGEGWHGALPTDGSFDENSESYYFDFDKELNSGVVEGYTVSVKSTNSNGESTNNFFYFTPFNSNLPLDEARISTSYPTFDFSVIKRVSDLKDNLSKYRIQIKKGGITSSHPWETYIDDVPIDGALDISGNVTVDNPTFKAVYTEGSSRMSVYSKAKSLLPGTYSWKVVSSDKSGKSQETESRTLYIRSSLSQTLSNTLFPLAITSITGLSGNPNISTYNSSKAGDEYTTSSVNPVFSGIAWAGSKVTVALTDQGCFTDCTKTYAGVTSSDSRFLVPLTENLSLGKVYTVSASVSLNDNYNELPEFSLKVAPVSSPVLSAKDEVKLEEKPSALPAPKQESQESKKKRCFWFICW